MSISNTGGTSAITVSGAVIPYAGSSAPSGWLLCDGSAVSRTTYATLFDVIGTTYGSGDGSTTFNVPDLRGRAIAGKDDMGGSAANRITSGGSGITGTTLGAAGGTQTHTLITGEIPAHNHGVTDPGHTHNYATGAAFGAGSLPVYSPQYNVVINSYTTGSATTGVSIQNTGGGGAHQNTQPTIILNYLIKT